jgi:hypothetical protein
VASTCIPKTKTPEAGEPGSKPTSFPVADEDGMYQPPDAPYSIEKLKR